jgi:16S rRNA pseudouridine516 synthase
MRLTKFLSLSVAMSRNQAKFFIRIGRVSVDGHIVTDPSLELAETSQVIFDGKPISVAEYEYILVHKPASYICAARDKEYISILELLENRSEDRYYYYANILGPGLTGLVLLSDDARWTSRIKRRLFTKTYIYTAELKNTVSQDQFQQIKEVQLSQSENQISPIIDIQRQDEKTLCLSMKQGRIQEIIAILSSVDLVIEKLHLKQLGKLCLGELAEGEYLNLTEDEIQI